MDERTKVTEGNVVPKLDSARGELRGSGGEDWVLFSGEAIRRVYAQEVMMLGTGAFVIWYNVGRAIGLVEGQKFAGMVETTGINDLAQNLGRTYNHLGWGVIEIGEIDLRSNEITITMRNSPMVRGVSNKEPQCWYVRGFMEGMVSSLLGVDATAFEVTCEAVNRSHCEFKVGWKPSNVSADKARR
jgi:predicted hydrocarbon binding protein